jgi:neutral ceramidase
MAQLLAGIGRADVTPRIGSKLIGYSNRPEGSKGVHDRLNARALVLDNGEGMLAICSVELLWLWGKFVREIRQAVAERCAIPPDHILLCCTHTHAGAGTHKTGDWDQPLVDSVADAIIQAY